MEYVADSIDNFAERYDDLESKEKKAVSYSFPNTSAYILYTHTGASGTTEDLEATEAEITDILDEMNPNDRPIAVRLMNIYEGILDEEGRTGNGLEIYKQIEIENVPDTINKIDWNGVATDVAGQIMSNLILKHTLPNANHRCSISMLEAYLELASIQRGMDFTMPQTHTPEYEWRDWVNPYIRQSKRILTIRRNNVRFKALHGYGCKTVVRKGDIEIDLADWELDMHYRDAWTQYAIEHEKLCIRFAEAIAERGNAPELREQVTLDQEQFASLLASTT